MYFPFQPMNFRFLPKLHNRLFLFDISRHSRRFLNVLFDYPSRLVWTYNRKGGKNFYCCLCQGVLCYLWQKNRTDGLCEETLRKAIGLKTRVVCRPEVKKSPTICLRNPSSGLPDQRCLNLLITPLCPESPDHRRDIQYDPYCRYWSR